MHPSTLSVEISSCPSQSPQPKETSNSKPPPKVTAGTTAVVPKALSETLQIGPRSDGESYPTTKKQVQVRGRRCGALFDAVENTLDSFEASLNVRVFVKRWHSDCVPRRWWRCNAWFIGRMLSSSTTNDDNFDY